MYNQSIEAYQLTKPSNHKYSLRQRFPHNKPCCQIIVSNPIKTIDILTQQNRFSNSEPQENYHQRGNQWEKFKYDHHEPNNIQNSKRTYELNRFTSVAYLGNHRTASTTPSLEYQLPNSLNNQLPSTKGDPQTKYSLKNCKKIKNYKSNAKFIHGQYRHQSDQRLFTDNYSQPVSTDQHPRDELHSEKDIKSKFSLKNKSKNIQKPQVLLNLKYSDLAHPGRPSSIENHLSIQTNSPLLQIKSKLLCTNSTSPEEGCKCVPKCFWMERWINIVGEHRLGSEYRNRDEKQWEAIIRQIERDIPRTQPDHPTFNHPQILNSLRDVLIGYAKLDKEVGYVQGMNFMAAVLVYHGRTSYDALLVINFLMKFCGLRQLYLGDLSFGRKIAQRLNDDLRRMSFDLYSHLMQQGIEIELFASSWYFSLCGSFVPLDSMHHFIDKFIRKGFAGINQLLIALFLKLRDKLLLLTDSQLMLVFSNQKLYELSAEMDWQQLRIRSDRLLLPKFQI